MDPQRMKTMADTHILRHEDGTPRWVWLQRVVPVVLSVAVIYLIFYLPHAINTDLRIGEVEDTLMEVRDGMYRYQEQRGVFADGPTDLGIDGGHLVDPISGKRLVWLSSPEGQPVDGALVWQPQPFRSRLWPFGRTIQYALFTDGSVRDFRSTDAADPVLPAFALGPTR